VWLDHRPVNPVELGTVMQPLMKRRKSVTKLTDAKDVANSKTSKYCLMTQEQDSSGELETRLYKVICLFVSQCISNPYKPCAFYKILLYFTMFNYQKYVVYHSEKILLF